MWGCVYFWLREAGDGGDGEGKRGLEVVCVKHQQADGR